MSKYECGPCGFKCNAKSDYNRHLKTKKHEKKQAGEEGYTCVECNYHTMDRSNFHRHLKNPRLHIENLANSSVPQLKQRQILISQRIIYKCQLKKLKQRYEFLESLGQKNLQKAELHQQEMDELRSKRLEIIPKLRKVCAILKPLNDKYDRWLALKSN